MAKKTDPNKYRDLKGYDSAAQDTIKSGLKSGKIRFEPNDYGGEYIYSEDKSFGKKKPRLV